MSLPPDAADALAAIRDLRTRLNDALMAGDPPASSLVGGRLVAELAELHRIASWCRDAGLAYARTDDRCTWAELAQASGISDGTLQSRLNKWYEREAQA